MSPANVAATRDRTRHPGGVRPEDVTVRLTPYSAGVEGRVLVVEPVGNETIVTLERDGTRIVARASADLTIRPEDTAWYSVEAGRALLFEADSGQRVS